MADVAVGQAVETDTATAVSIGIGVGRAVERDYGLRVNPVAAAESASVPRWKIVITERDGTEVATFAAGDDPEDSPIVAFEGQDPLNDVGAGSIVVPLSSPYIDAFVENRLLHLYSYDKYLTSFIIGATDDVVLHENVAEQVATVHLSSLLDMLNEGIIMPPQGFGVRPRGEDRRFDWSDPSSPGGGGTSVLGTVTEAQTEYPVTPYAANITYPDDVSVLGAPGYSIGDDAPAGTAYASETHNFAGGSYIFRGACDNWLETFRIDGTELLGYTFGFVEGWETPRIVISGGPHKIAWAFTNQDGTGAGPCTTAVECVKLDGGGGEGDDSVLEWATSGSTGIIFFPSSPPGMTFTQIARIFLEENQALGALERVVTGFTDTTASGGTATDDLPDISTKSRTAGGTFFLHEMAPYCESKMTPIAGGLYRWDLYPAGELGVFTGASIEASNLGSPMEITREKIAATKLAYATHDLYLLAAVSPPDGQPVRIASVDYQAAGTAAEGERLATADLADFARTREKVALNDIAADGRYYWTGEALDSVASTRDPAHPPDDNLRVKCMTFHLDSNGIMRFTPEFGDLIVPVEARATLAVRKMGGPVLGGRSGTATRG